MALLLAILLFSSSADSPPAAAEIDWRREADTRVRDSVFLPAPAPASASAPAPAPPPEVRVRIRDRSGRIRTLELEEYLRGVVGAEMPSDFPWEALKAQAVAARTYALERHLSSGGGPLAVTVSDQVYLGPAAYSDTIDRAVEATRGEVLYFEGRLAPVRYHADCGGATSNGEPVFGDTSLPHLAGVSDVRPGTTAHYCTGPRHTWEVEIPGAVVRRAAHLLGLSGAVRAVAAAETDAAGRWLRVRLESARDSVVVLGNDFRLAVGPFRLPSMKLDRAVRERNGDSFRFAGGGFGHGVGMCQWGAKGRAEAGYTAEAILRAYYPNAVVAPLDAALHAQPAALDGARQTE